MIVWKKNRVVPDMPQMTIRRMRIACWLPKTIDTLRICNTTATMVMRKRLNVTFHLHCSLVCTSSVTHMTAHSLGCVTAGNDER